MQNILKLWKLKNLTIEGRIVVFNSLTILKIIRLALVTDTPTLIIKLLKKRQRNSYGKDKI